MTEQRPHPYLEPYEHRVTLREADCTGIVMYQSPEPPEGLGGPAPETDWCTPRTLEVAAVSAPLLPGTAAPVAASGLTTAVVAPLAAMPPSDLPEDLARIETRSELESYLEVEPAGFRTAQTCEIFPRETLGKPDMDDAARDAAGARIGRLNGVAETSRLVGDGPVDCDSLGDGSQECTWFINNQAQGFNLVGTAAHPKKPANPDADPGSGDRSNRDTTKIE